MCIRDSAAVEPLRKLLKADELLRERAARALAFVDESEDAFQPMVDLLKAPDHLNSESLYYGMRQAIEKRFRNSKKLKDQLFELFKSVERKSDRDHGEIAKLLVLLDEDRDPLIATLLKHLKRHPRHKMVVLMGGT